jgi:O-antigen ligase
MVSLQTNKLNTYQNFLVIALLFTITLKTSVAYALAFLIIIMWLLGGQLKPQFLSLIKDRLSLSFLLLFAMHCIGLIWTESFNDGLKILSKQKIYLFAPILIVCFEPKMAKYALQALLSSIFISEFYSIYLYFFSDANSTPSHPSPFMNHMHYSLILCFTFGYMLSLVEIAKRYSRHNMALLFLAGLTLFVLFINQGRVGQLAIPLVLFILAIWKFKLPVLRSLIGVALLASLLFTCAYNLSEQFKVRIDRATHEYSNVIGTGKRASISCRFEMWRHATTIGTNNPLIGVGTGDSIVEMKKLLGADEFQLLFKECNLGIKYQFNPHNNFVLIYMQFGAAGLVLFLLVLAMQIRIAQQQKSVPMAILLAVSITGMMTASPISMHVKYMFFYAFVLSILYLQSLNKKNISNNG